MSSVFRVAKRGPDKSSQVALIQWADDHPGLVARGLLKKMHDIVGQDGEVTDKNTAPPACAKQYDLRIMKHQAGPHGFNARNQRELTTLSTVLDHLVLGRYKKAADVVAARLKSVEAANREGNFANGQFLELILVNTEGLTTADEKQVLRNEALMNKPTWKGSGGDWSQSGKGTYGNYQCIPEQKGKGKEKKGKEAKGKGKGKGKKGTEE